MSLSSRFKTYIALVLFIFSFPVFSQPLSWEQAFEQHHVIMLLVRPKGGLIVKANTAASDFYGYSISELESMSIQHINVLSPKAVVEEMALAKKEQRNYFIFSHRLADQTVKTVEVSSIPVVYNGERLLYSIIRDISEFREAQDGLWHYQNRLEEMVAEQAHQLTVKHRSRFFLLFGISISLLVLLSALLRQVCLQRRTKSLLEREKKRLSDVIWGANVGTWEWDVKRDELHVSDFALSLIGYEQWPFSPLTRVRVKRLCHEGDWVKATPNLIANLKGEASLYESEVRVRHKKGHWVWILTRGRVIERDNDTNEALVVAGTFQEVTMQKNMHEQLYQYAHIDLLAEVPNRRSFNECLEDIYRLPSDIGSQHALFYIDLNKFKFVNDCYGHEAGDEVIKNVGKRLKKLTRSSDHVFRIGGDEFAVLVKNIESLTVVDTIADKIKLGLSQPHRLSNGEQVITPPSIGVAVYPKDGSNSDCLISHADQMMYLAKHRHPFGGYEVYTPDKCTVSSQRSQIQCCRSKGNVPINV